VPNEPGKAMRGDCHQVGRATALVCSEPERTHLIRRPATPIGLALARDGAGTRDEATGAGLHV